MFSSKSKEKDSHNDYEFERKRTQKKIEWAKMENMELEKKNAKLPRLPWRWRNGGGYTTWRRGIP